MLSRDYTPQKALDWLFPPLTCLCTEVVAKLDHVIHAQIDVPCGWCPMRLTAPHSRAVTASHS
eukprot:43175-Eustigmatos_ZCMA.PRE.1